MKKIIITIVAIIATVAIAGTIVEVPKHQQDIKLWRVVLTLNNQNSADVTAYFKGAQGKMSPVTISQGVIRTYGKILAVYIQQIMDAELARLGYKVVGTSADWDVSGVDVKESLTTETIDGEERKVKTTTIREVL